MNVLKATHKYLPTLGYISMSLTAIMIVAKIIPLPVYLIAIFQTSTGILLSLYIPLFLVVKWNKSENEKLPFSHLAFAFTFAMLIAGIVIRHIPFKFSLGLIGLSIITFNLIVAPLLMKDFLKLKHQKWTNIIGLLGVMSFTLGWLLKVFGLSQGGPLLLLSFVLLFIFYFPKIMSDKKVEKKRRDQLLLNNSITIIVFCLLAYLIYVNLSGSTRVYIQESEGARKFFNYLR